MDFNNCARFTSYCKATLVGYQINHSGFVKSKSITSQQRDHARQVQKFKA